MKSYNIYIPIYYNDGTKIPKEKIAKIVSDVNDKFGFSSFIEEAKMPHVEGMWTSKNGIKYSDKVSLLYLILEDTQEHYKWFTAQAEIWRQALEQEEFLIEMKYAEVIIAKK